MASCGTSITLWACGPRRAACRSRRRGRAQRASRPWPTQATGEDRAPKQEQSGRRRKRYAITAKGREALFAWRAEPPDQLAEMREPALLKLFFGADPKELATTQLAAHRRRLAEYEAIRERIPRQAAPGTVLALEAGIGHEHTWIRFWEELASR